MKKVREIIKLGAVLMIYTLIAGALLSFVYIKTYPIIEANKKDASGDAVMIQVLQGMEGGFVPQEEGNPFPYWIGYSDAGRSNPGGYIFIAKGKGYSSTIESMIGVDMDGNISGVKVLFQQETPGIGDKIEEIRPREETPWFTNQFLGKTISDNLAVTKDGGTIDAISGATVSSRAVANSIVTGLNNLQAILSGKEVVIEEPVEIIETEASMDPLIIPSIEEIQEMLPNISGDLDVVGEETEFPYWIGYKDGNRENVDSYVFVARGEGFSSTIQILIGIDTDGQINGIKTLFQGETPGYGDIIEEILDGDNTPWFTDQFLGISSSDNIALKDNGGVIDAISGATISSNAVIESIKLGLNNIKDALAGKTFPIRIEPEEEDEEDMMSQLLGLSDEEEDEEDMMSQLMGLSDEEEDEEDMMSQLMGRSDEEDVSETENTDFNKMLAEVLPSMRSWTEINEVSSGFSYWIGHENSDNSQPSGYAFVSRGEGFASIVESLVGVDTEGTIVALIILSHDETPGYGDKIEEIRDGEDKPWFTRQFFGKSVSDNITLKNDGGEIDAITGATITSKAVAESVNAGLIKLMEFVSE